MVRVLLTVCLMLSSLALRAGEPVEMRLVIKDHRFEPAELKVPAGKKIKLLVENHDATPEEFESYQLNREKIVGGNGRITVWIGPLKAGRYPFFGEFNADTAQGVVIAE